MAKKKAWFQEAVFSKRPNNLGGWKKDQSPSTRRANAISSRLGSNQDKRALSAGRALNALANVSKDPGTKRAAKSDANYFFDRARKLKSGNKQ